MTVTAKQLGEEMGVLHARAKEFLQKVESEKRDFTAEEDANWKKLNDDINAIKVRKDRLAAMEAQESEFEKPEDRGAGLPGRDNANPANREQAANIEERTAKALHGWMLAQSGREVSDEHRTAAKAIGVRLNDREIGINLRSDYRQARREWRAQNTISLSAGGVLVQPSFMGSLESALLDFGGMRQVATVMRTSTGGTLNWPTANDTSNTGALIAENAAVSEQDITFGNIEFHDYKYTSKMVKVSAELLNDSSFNLVSYLGSALGERLGRIGNTHQTTGDGASKPWGIVPKATVGVTAASATAIKWDEVYGLIHSVDPAYRRGPGAGFMMHDSIVLYLRKLKDGQGNYLWSMGATAAEPDRIAGYSYVVNQDMASSIAASAKTILFGQLSKYHIRDVGEIRLKRAAELYLENDQEAFVAFLRSDGNLVDAGTNPVKVLQQA